MMLQRLIIFCKRKRRHVVYTKVEPMSYNYAKHRDSDEDLEYFISKFECRVEDSREYNQYVRPTSYHKDFYDRDSFQMETKIIPMKAIHLTSDNLARLVAEQEHMQRLGEDAEYGKRAWDHERRDQMVRDKNPAVEKAYQKYQMLLGLCR
jgi:hypothetical protein